MKRIIGTAAAIVFSTAVFMPLQASAVVNVNIIVPVPPPPLVVEAAPPPRVGYIWAPGYWSWNDGKHVWTDGHWERAREGERYERSEWRRDGDKWRFHEGGWKKAKHKKNKHPHSGGFCPPGQAKKGNC
jgi:hypothetical protein